MQDKRKQLLQKSSAMVAPNQVLPMKHSLRLNTVTAEHELTIEATAPIFCVAVMSTAKVEFLESIGSVAILTTSESVPGSAAQSLATYRWAPTPLAWPSLLRLSQTAHTEIAPASPCRSQTYLSTVNFAGATIPCCVW